MILKQMYLGCLAQASYLIVDEKTRKAIVVDPRRDVDEYLEEAAKHEARIEHVLLTHFHADFVAGDRELRARTGARIWLGAAAEPVWEHGSLADGDTLVVGDVRIEALATPGHTPESTCYVVYDLAADPETPHAVLTGDTLFIGDVGRPDLLGSVGLEAEDLAAMMYDTLHEKLLKLPDDTLVYPGHGAGSMCGKNLSSDTVSTIGKQRASNWALQPMEKAAFVKALTEGQPAAPAYFVHDVKLNKGERGTIDAALAQGVRPLALDEVLRLQDDGAQVLDVRDVDEVGRGTMRGALHVSLAGSFATWSGSLLDLERPVIVLAAPGRETEAVTRLARVGLDRVVGYVDGGAGALAKHPELVQKTPQIDVEELRKRLAGPNPPRVLDVRTPGEWEAGHIEGALHVPLIELQQRLDEVPQDGTLAVICRTSMRSASAVSILRRAGHENLVHTLGGMSQWAAGGAACTTA